MRGILRCRVELYGIFGSNEPPALSVSCKALDCPRTGKPLSVEINPKFLRGPWDAGFALDKHTRSITYLGVDQWGHDRYETTRSPVGELLY